MHEAMHTEIQEKRLKGQLLWNSFRSWNEITGCGKFNKEEEDFTHHIWDAALSTHAVHSINRVLGLSSFYFYNFETCYDKDYHIIYTPT
jgi:hypothetical protein